MRAIAMLLCLASLALPAFSQDRVTVAQLDQIVAAMQGLHDAPSAQRLSELVLTERLSEPHLVRLQANLPGPVTQKRLALLSDASAFFDLPAAELPSTPMPDRAAQTHLFKLAHDYVVNTLLKLPNFFATRDTASYLSTPANTRVASVNTIRFSPYEEQGHSDVTVLYRNGRELIAKGRRFAGSAKELRTVGEFGPILVTVLNDCAKGGTVVWSHWEQGATGPQAVFHYVIPQPASHYLVAFFGITQLLQHYPGYHGEIALNPADGSILRLTIVADLEPNDALTRAELAVYYGPAEIGGVQYICPVKSVALATARVLIQGLNEGAMVDLTSLGDPKNYLNEVRFTDYHIFRSELRILAGDADPNDIPSAPAPANAPTGEAAAPVLSSEADVLNRPHGIRYSVPDFERVLAEAHKNGNSDAELLQHLSSVQLTERLGSAELARLEAEFPGPKVKQTLTAIADASAFLALPESEIPRLPALDAITQASLLNRAMKFSEATVSRLPDFSAIRETISFEDTLAVKEKPYQPLHKVGKSSGSVVFKDGHETVEDTKKHKTETRISEVAMPEFSFMLSTVVADAVKGEIDWDHWELGATGNEAVFFYEVPEESSHFLRFASHDIVTGSTLGSTAAQNIGYHGEIWVNPADGSILRLSVIAELKAPGPVSQVDYVVDYGPVTIDAVSHFLPIKAVMIELRTDFDAASHRSGDEHQPSESGPLQKQYLSDVSYQKYRVINPDKH